ncbi:MAG: glycosyltransferase [Clostridia bacterium]|nr:glycosyltransferase [Clostridia bacterium]
MLKVLQVCSDTNIGGAGKCILTYLKHCNKKELEIAVVLPKDSLLKPEVEALGFKVFEIDAMADKSLDMAAVKKLLAVFREFKPDIVHTHASMSARIAARLFGAKIVYTRHSVFPPSPKLTHGIGKLVCGLVNNSTADKIIAVAEAAKQNICDIGVSDKKIDVILNGVEPQTKYSAKEITAAKAEYKIPDDCKCTAIVARLNEVKGHKYFVEAARILKDRGVKARFLIAGTGDMEESIRKQIAENKLEDYVIMLGFLTNVAPLMNVIDVQANCSFGTEATSLSLLEGMSLGKPAVVSDFGGNPGVIKSGKNGYIVPTHDATALANRLEELFTNEKLYAEMSKTSLEIFNSTFTAAVYAENIDNIYLNLGGKNNG